MMLESNLHEGNQKLPADLTSLSTACRLPIRASAGRKPNRCCSPPIRSYLSPKWCVKLAANERESTRVRFQLTRLANFFCRIGVHSRSFAAVFLRVSAPPRFHSATKSIAFRINS